MSLYFRMCCWAGYDNGVRLGGILATALSAVMAYIIGVKMGVGDFAAARQTKIGVKSE